MNDGLTAVVTRHYQCLHCEFTGHYDDRDRFYCHKCKIVYDHGIEHTVQIQIRVFG